MDTLDTDIEESEIQKRPIVHIRIVLRILHIDVYSIPSFLHLIKEF